MPGKGPVLRGGCLWALAWVLVLAAPPELVQASSQDTEGSVGVALEPAPPPGFFRMIVQVRPFRCQTRDPAAVLPGPSV